MWYAGQGFSGLETFTAIMDMPGTMTSKNYDKIANKWSANAKNLAVETMLETSDELKNDGDEVTDVSRCIGFLRWHLAKMGDILQTMECMSLFRRRLERFLTWK